MVSLAGPMEVVLELTAAPVPIHPLYSKGTSAPDLASSGSSRETSLSPDAQVDGLFEMPPDNDVVVTAYQHGADVAAHVQYR